MIVISSSVVLSSGLLYGPNSPLIGWHNLVDISNIAADSEQDGFPATNLANPATNSLWKSDSAAEQYLTVTLDSIDPVDYVAFARHNFGTGIIAVTVEALSEESGEWEEALAPVLPADDSPLVLRIESLSRYGVRVKFNPTGATKPQAAVMYVGKLLVLPRRIYLGHTPITDGRVSRVLTGYSESSEFLGRALLSRHLETGFELGDLDPDWYRDYMRTFIESAVLQPFFFVWRPQDYPLEVGYIWTTSDPVPRISQISGEMTIQFQVRGIA